MKTLLLLIASITIGIWFKPSTPDLFVTMPVKTITEASTPIPTPTPKRSEVIAYIAKTFEPEGAQVMVKAVECFYSESGLRWNAVNTNKNGTKDGGVSQLNDVHKMTLEERLDYKKNIDKAYELYKRQGFNPWYGKLCK